MQDKNADGAYYRATLAEIGGRLTSMEKGARELKQDMAELRQDTTAIKDVMIQIGRFFEKLEIATQESSKTEELDDIKSRIQKGLGSFV